MKMDLSEFFESGENYYSFSGNINESEINFYDRDIEIKNPVKYSGEIFILDDGEKNIHIDIEFTYEEPCSRCLKPSVKVKKTSLSGRLVEGQEDYGASEDEEQEDIIFFEENKLDTLYYIRSQVYLSLPMQTLCQDDCKGLCSICGIDLNNGKCDCTQDDIDPRLLKLKDFFPKK